MASACRSTQPVNKYPSISTRIFICLFCYGMYVVGFCEAGNFYKDFVIHWGGIRSKIHENGNMLTLSLDNSSASGFHSKLEYMFGKIDMLMKLVPGNSAGTVTAYYLASDAYETRDEIDMEFLGNLTGDPYTLHTNIYTGGIGDREQQFQLWFDPTQAFHTYSILWNPSTIVISVDGIPIRQAKNLEVKGIPFPRTKPMRLYSSIWSADQWATRGGLIKTDWSQAPFVASYRNYNPNACIWSSGRSLCSRSRALSWFSQKLDAAGLQKLRWVQKRHMIYNYCTDTKRFLKGVPHECRIGGS